MGGDEEDMSEQAASGSGYGERTLEASWIGAVVETRLDRLR